MQKKYLYAISIMLLLAGVVVVVLLRGADLPNKLDNGFNRDIVKKFKEPTLIVRHSEYVTRICGISPSSVYLSGNSPEWVLKVDHNLNLLDTLWYGINGRPEMGDPTIYVDSPHIYMYEYPRAYLLKGWVDSSRLDTVKIESELMTRVAQISYKRLVVRGIDSTQSRQIFRLIDGESGASLKVVDLINNQQFGGFETDGYLKFDKKTNHLFYIQMFQNRIYCLDTSLNIVYTSNTIDTTFSNTVKIDLVNDGGSTKVMSTKPRTVVNKIADVYNNRIFVVSGLRGDNETLSNFNAYFPVDIYNGSNGNYLGSITIPKIDGKNVRDLKVTDLFWIVLYDGGTCALFNVDDE